MSTGLKVTAALDCFGSLPRSRPTPTASPPPTRPALPATSASPPPRPAMPATSARQRVSEAWPGSGTPLPRAYLLHRLTCVLIAIGQLLVAVSQWTAAATVAARLLPFITFLLCGAIAFFVVQYPRLYWSNR